MGVEEVGGPVGLVAVECAAGGEAIAAVGAIEDAERAV